MHPALRTYYYSSSQGGAPYSDNSENTTADGRQVFWVIGDSNTDGRAVSKTSVSAGILRAWNGSAFIEVTTGTMANGGDYGSAWQQFAIDHNANSTRKSDVVNSGKGGSNLYPTGAPDEHWMGSGAPTGVDLYEPAKTELLQALAADGLTKPKAIMIVGLGINDFGAGTSVANAGTGLDALITNITTDFPGVPILYTVTGVDSSTDLSANDTLYGIRNLQIQKARVTTDLHIVGAGASCIGAGGYEADEIHYNNDGLDHLGACYARWFKNLSIVTEKWSRSVISSHFDDLSTARKALIETAVSALVESGEYWKLEHWSRGKTTIQNNFFLDWTFLGHASKIGAPGFTANEFISTDGVSATTRYTFTDYDGAAMRAATKTDFIQGVELITNNGGGAGSNQFLFGALNSGVGSRDIEDTFSGIIRYRSDDNTQTTGANVAKLEDNSFHCIARNSGNKILLRDTTVRNTTAVAGVTTVGSLICSIGAINASSPLAATYGTVFKAKYSDFDLETFIEINRAISDGWNL
jgi:hypothetical protein